MTNKRGRKTGQKNVATVLEEQSREASPQMILHMVFHHKMGGLDGFAAWAKKNPDKFYEMFRKTSPSSRMGQSHKGGAPRDQTTKQEVEYEVRDFTK